MTHIPKMCNKEKQVLLSLIEMYKEMPFLWKKDDNHYMDKEMRAEGFKVLLETYKNFDKNSTEDTIKWKFKNLRRGYGKQLKKVMASKRSGAGAEEVYVPTLWYYDALSFLGSGTESSRTVQDSLPNKNSLSGNFSGGRQKRKQKETLLEKQQNIVSEKHMSEWEVYGRYIGFQMRDLNKRQLMISQKIISDVLFHAKLDQLSEYSCLDVRSPNESTIHHRQNQFHSPSPLQRFSAPSPSHQPQSPFYSLPQYTFHTESVCQPLPSPQQKTQLSNSPSPHQPSSNAQVQVHHTQTVHQPLQSAENLMQLLNLSSPSSSHQLSRSYQPTSKGQVSILRSLLLSSPDAQAHYPLHHQSPYRHPSPNNPAQAQLPRQSQELPSDSLITLDYIEQFLNYFANENANAPDANSLSLPITEDFFNTVA